MAQTHICRGVATSVNRKAFLAGQEPLSVRYHGTEVLRHDKTTGETVLSTGGWKSVTTKTRINQAAREFGLGFSLFQMDGEWYIQTPRITTRWAHPGLTRALVYADGSVHFQD